MFVIFYLQNYRDNRKDELETMREEWLRLQTLADVKTSRETHLWALLRGLFSRSSSSGGRKKSTSGSSSVLSSSSSNNNNSYNNNPNNFDHDQVSSSRQGLHELGPPPLVGLPPSGRSKRDKNQAKELGAIPKTGIIRASSVVQEDYDVPRKLSLDQFPEFKFDQASELPQSFTAIKIVEKSDAEKPVYENVIVE